MGALLLSPSQFVHGYSEAFSGPITNVPQHSIPCGGRFASLASPPRPTRDIHCPNGFVSGDVKNLGKIAPVAWASACKRRRHLREPILPRCFIGEYLCGARLQTVTAWGHSAAAPPHTGRLTLSFPGKNAALNEDIFTTTTPAVVVVPGLWWLAIFCSALSC